MWNEPVSERPRAPTLADQFMDWKIAWRWVVHEFGLFPFAISYSMIQLERAVHSHRPCATQACGRGLLATDQRESSSTRRTYAGTGVCEVREPAGPGFLKG